jgi:hypothetical protein
MPTLALGFMKVRQGTIRGGIVDPGRDSRISLHTDLLATAMAKNRIAAERSDIIIDDCLA